MIHLPVITKNIKRENAEKSRCDRGMHVAQLNYGYRYLKPRYTFPR